MICQRRSFIERTSVHSLPSRETARTQSPERSPACSATLAGSGALITARGSSVPSHCAAANSSTASSRLAAGPAMTMAARRDSGWRLKARCSSSAGTGASRSSSMRT